MLSSGHNELLDPNKWHTIEVYKAVNGYKEVKARFAFPVLS